MRNKTLSTLWKFRNTSKVSQSVGPNLVMTSSTCYAQPSNNNKHFSRSYATAKRPVVIGGSNVDIVATATEDIKMDGRMLNGTISQCCGGVGRNIANALARLNMNPLLLTAIGNDELGQFLVAGSKHMDNKGFLRCKEYNSGCCCVIVDSDRECKFIIGNMNIHSQISLDWIRKFEEDIMNSSFLVLDGNLGPTAFDYILKTCHSLNIPVWFEPTDIAVCHVIFSSKEWTSITHISPNFNELKHMSSVLTGKDYSHMNPSSLQDLITQSITLARNFPKSMVVMVTLGKHGMVLICGDNVKYYAALPVDNIANVSGAGDCAVGGYIAAHLCNRSETEKVFAALSCARQSLMSTTPVPSHMSLDLGEAKYESYSSQL
ncbi:uncharacterized protein LOC103522331 [Diaphorina citri]|uniref:Uncharacterized protein LOC103522331 n=1 Tax=Diaphorina citri TaxID=121845 RepID=A0A1S3DPV8_DIACI|nr:uncharacterized protein LOC103522331 [Diaphorina citri]